MMLDTENNFSNGSDHAERYGRKDFSTGEVVLGCTSVADNIINYSDIN